jgi:WD40 repeat protein
VFYLDGQSVNDQRVNWSTGQIKMTMTGVLSHDVLNQINRFAGGSIALLMYNDPGDFSRIRAEIWIDSLAKGTAKLKTTSHITGCKYSPDGKRLITIASSPDSPDACIWDAMSGAAILTLNSHHPNKDYTTTTCEYSDNGKLIATGRQGNVYIWDSDTGILLRTFTLHTSEEGYDGRLVLECKFVYKSILVNTILVNGEDKLYHWSIENGDLLSSEFTSIRLNTSIPNPFFYTPNPFSKKSQFIARVCKGEIVIVNLVTRTSLHILEDRISIPNTEDLDYEKTQLLSFSPDETWLLSAHDNMTFRWNVATGELLSSKTHVLNIDACAISPDGKTIAVTQGLNVHLWNV